jgi:hypothetical protein
MMHAHTIVSRTERSTTPGHQGVRAGHRDRRGRPAQTRLTQVRAEPTAVM